jgi:predicted CXXCH cytochrome family protein
MKIYMLKLKSFSIAVIVLSMFAWTNVAADVANTPHNLGTSAGGGPNTFSATAEICVFCHTPHGGDTTAAVPLWNRTLAAPASYTTYDSLGSTSMDAAEAPVGSVSIACLSCHDGTQAMDTLLNDPGSGAVVASFTGGTWTGNDRPQGIANLGQDLSNDHPIGIQYGGGGITVSAPTAATNDLDFVAPDNAVINSSTVWWVDTEATPNGTREKTDMQLYTRTEATVGNVAQPFVECASCHDPHSEVATFLRVPNTGSAVCLACHNK